MFVRLTFKVDVNTHFPIHAALDVIIAIILTVLTELVNMFNLKGGFYRSTTHNFIPKVLLRGRWWWWVDEEIVDGSAKRWMNGYLCQGIIVLVGVWIFRKSSQSILRCCRRGQEALCCCSESQGSRCIQAAASCAKGILDGPTQPGGRTDARR